VYTDADGADAGGLYTHRSTGLTVRVLGIESVPQVFLHVWTPPTTDMGEPHTGEHLLLGKGTKGKALAAAEEMSLVESTAYTAQTEVCYSFNCAAGQETFFRTLAQTLDALLYPDYDDDEIRQEVCHLAAIRDPVTGELELEEKGTVYNEMVASDEKRWNVFRDVARRLYGEGHPLANASGGTPAGIRTLTPEQVRRFHRDHYHVANVGLIASLPPTIPAAEFLERLDAMVSELAARATHTPTGPARDLPPATPSHDRSLLRLPYPNANEQDTGYLVLAWPPRAASSVAEHLLRHLLLEGFADGETSLLHRVLLDSATRRLEVPAARVWSDLDPTPVGDEASLGFTGFSAAAAQDEERVRAVERAVREELDRLAAREPGDEALEAFNRRVETSLRELERNLKRRLGSPPLFGRRGGGGGFWLEHMRLVDRGGGARRSLVLADAIADVRARLQREPNPWGQLIDDLRLRDAPVIGVSFPSGDEIKRRTIAREERLATALQRLQLRHGTRDPAEALLRLEAEASAVAKRLEARDAALKRPPLVDDLPRTLDDELTWEEDTVRGVPALSARFAAMSAVEVSLSFRLDGLARDELVLLPILPQLVVSTGLLSADGTRLVYHELRERLEREIGGLTASFDMRPETRRYELRVTGSGADLAEARLAVDWLRRCLLETDLSAENLPRLRDLVRQRSRDLRGALGRSEEGWVRNPAQALRFGDDLLFLSAHSIHTRLLHVWRLEWLLARPPSGEDAKRAAGLFAAGAHLIQRESADAALDQLKRVIEAGSWPEELAPPELLPVLPPLRDPDASEFLSSVGKRVVDGLAELRRDLPPERAQQDLSALLVVLAGDLAADPLDVLARLRRLLQLLRPRALRLTLTGRGESLRGLRPDLERLVQALEGAPHERGASQDPLRAEAPLASARLAARHPDEPPPVHYGLVHEASSSGVFVFSAGLGAPLAADPQALRGLLAGSIDSGAGPHALFMRTWGAGLAYSNGLRGSPLWGRVSYYAERCPDPVATMRFVVALATDAERASDPALLDYALAQLVGVHRMADRFETRARAQANDLQDGLSPERVRAQRDALLLLRHQPDTWQQVLARHREVVGRVLVGLGSPAREQPDAVFLTIAPERLLAEWEAYVREVEGPQERVFRLYPADLWVWPTQRETP
jgi:Zn-dependent M16 (insulinase) family peptidase